MPPSEYVSRFSRNALDPVAQKIYDQLKDQRERIEKSAGPEAAAKLYTDISGLNPDESLAMMAQELQSTGITDIYKVKQDTQRIPVQMVTSESSEGGANYTTSFIDPSGQEVRDSSKVQRDAQGNYYEERPQFLNTETGKPLVTSVGRGEFQNDPNILTDMGVGKRMYSGTGVRFNDEGSPIYFSTGLKRDSNLTSFLKGAAPVLGMAAGLFAGPAGLKLGSLASGAIGGGVSGLLGSGGELDEALKSAALGAAMGYGREALFGAAPSALDAGMGTYDPSGFNPITAPTFDPSLAQSTLVDELVAGNSDIPAGTTGIEKIIAESPVIPSDYKYVDDVFSGSGAPTPDVALPEAPAGAGYDVGYALNEVNQPFLENTLGDPTAGYGGMPKTPPMTPAEARAALMAGGTGDPYIASELAGSAPSTWDPTLASSLAAFAATPVGKLAMTIGGSALVNKLFNEQQGGGAGVGTSGWSGEIPKYQMVRERVPLADAGRRPGEYGRRYFSDTSFVPITPGEANAEANLGLIQQAQQAAQAQATGLASLPPGIAERRAMPTPTVKYQTAPTQPTTPFAGLPVIPTYVQEPRLSYDLPTPDERLEATNFRTPEERKLGLASGGLASLARGRYLNGPTDGMEDKLKATIEGKQPARLSHGEFVIPADVVSHLGNGNSQAGAKRLYDMMDKIRHARTGTKKQGKQINPDKYLPI